HVETPPPATAHRAKFALDGPVLPQSIPGTNARPPPPGGPVERDRKPGGTYAAAAVDPGPAHLAIDKPAIHEGVTDPACQRRDPIDARARRHVADAPAAPYGRPSEVSFDAQHPLRVELEIVSDLAAANQTTAAAAIEPSRANMGAHIESRPAIERQWRGRTAR